jgi:hypothetical protein
MNENVQDLNRQQLLFWKQMYQLKVAALYIRFYRDHLGKWVTSLATLKAIASFGGIAAWVVWKEYAFLWGAIIAASQVADALKDVFPFTRKHKAASELAMILESLFIDNQLEWESVFSLRYTEDETMASLHRLRKLQFNAESQHFPEGLASRAALFERANQEAWEFFQTTYGIN